MVGDFAMVIGYVQKILLPSYPAYQRLLQRKDGKTTAFTAATIAKL